MRNIYIVAALLLGTLGCSQRDLVGSSSAAVSLGSGPTTVGLNDAGTSTSQGNTVETTVGPTSFTCNQPMSITGTWTAKVESTSSSPGTYNIRYQIHNNSTSVHSIRLAQTTNYTNDGTVDVDWRNDLSGINPPSLATRSSDNSAILWQFGINDAGAGTDVAPGNNSMWFYVDANANTYAGSGASLQIWDETGFGPCTITATGLPYVHN